MISAVVEIIIGLIVWKMVPGWITEGNKSARDVIKLACNIIGIILVIAGCYSLVITLIGHH
jgi:hypothetical protein